MSEPIFSSDLQAAAWQGPAWLEHGLSWAQRRQTALLIAGAGFQIAVLLVMIGILATPLLVGQTVMLRVVPVDPRDLFRGDYVTLSYEISRAPQGIEGILPLELADRHASPRAVYVSLEPEADGRPYYRRGKVSTTRPTSGKYLRGTYTADWRPGGQLRFGIESFYIPEGTGEKYEQARQKGQLWAEVALTSWGQAALRDLRIEPAP
jgi:uncharacterized membrane-anchored protein